MDKNFVSGEIADAALRVHRALGPGLLESAYEACLVHELLRKDLPVRSQVELPIHYGDVKLDIGYRIDLLVSNTIIVELKTVEKILPIHEAQILSYMKLSGSNLGLLLNFNSIRLREGIRRFII